LRLCEDERKIADRLKTLLPDEQIDIRDGEAWSDAALEDLDKMSLSVRQAWNALLKHCQAGGKRKLTPKCGTTAEALLAAVGHDSLKEHVLRWFPLVDHARTWLIPRRETYFPEVDANHLLCEPHVELLRGLAWCCGFQEDVDVA